MGEESRNQNQGFLNKLNTAKITIQNENKDGYTTVCPDFFKNVQSDVVLKDEGWYHANEHQREVNTIQNMQKRAKINARLKQGLTAYPDQDMDFTDYQVKQDADFYKTIKAMQDEKHAINLNYVEKPTVHTMK